MSRTKNITKKVTKRQPINLKPHFVTGANNPLDDVKWTKSDVTIAGDTSAVFTQKDVEHPIAWGSLAVKIAASKYLYGDIDNGTDPYKGGRENSIRVLIERVVGKITDMGIEQGYLSKAGAKVFSKELAAILVQQRAAFNSPVWFNVGLDRYGCGKKQQGNWRWDERLGKAIRSETQYDYPQSSACFIQSVEDNMESILNLAHSEAMLFKYGSGTGSDLSPLRSTREKLSGGGKPSGPMSFLKVYDQIAGTVKSGGKCLSARQPIWTVNGVFTAKELAESGQDFIGLAFDPPSGQLKVKKGRAWAEGMKLVVRITTDKGVFEPSSDHPMRLSTGEYTPAGALQPGMSLHAGSVDEAEGYLRVHLQNGKKGKEHVHRMVASQISNTNLKGLVVDHIDGNKHNNTPENLKVKTQAEHAKRHSLDAVEAGIHVFQTNKFPKKGNANGMHSESAFWKDEQKVADYKATQGTILKDSGRAQEMQTEAAKTKRCNTAFQILNAGYKIDTFEEYYDGFKKAIGRVGYSKAKIQDSINGSFGSFDAFVAEVGARNHRVLSVEILGMEQVYDVEIDCPTLDDKTPKSGHNFLIFPIGATSAIGTGVFVSNTRRAAKMNILKDWHPDIEEFINAKTLEEKKAWALIDAGYDGSFNGEAYASVMYQNENLSVRATDRFMTAAVEGREWWTKRVSDGQKCEKKDARDLLRKIAEGTHVCGDPGMQFDDTIHKYHTCKGTERQNATNPCSEYLFLDDTACNLASINLLKYKNTDGSFDVVSYIATIRILILAQDILVDGASYPSESITANSHQFRTLGLGFANIGALLMSYGVGYDSDEGRHLCSALTSLMTGEAYAQSARISQQVGPFPSYLKADSQFFPATVGKDNIQPMHEVMELHSNSNSKIPSTKLNQHILKAATTSWSDALKLGEAHGYRNAQVTVLAPTGTIGFLMGCDTTGIEPAIALVAHKTLAGGGYLPIVNGMVPAALTSLGYSSTDITTIEKHILDNGTIEGAPRLKEQHLSVFDCAFVGGSGTRSLSYMGHLRMMAAAQPFLSGAISKTVNLPETASVDDIMETYIEAWKMGLKAVAIYRDGSKRSAPLTTKKAEEPKTAELKGVSTHPTPVRRRLENERTSITHKFQVGGQEGYITVGLFQDGKPGEMFIRMSKQGSTISGLMDVVATMFSMALQYGVPLETLVNKFSHSSFAPAGFTGNKELPSASSVIDYIVRYMNLRFGADAPVLLPGTIQKTEPQIEETMEELAHNDKAQHDTGKICHNCGSSDIVVSGTCGVCTNCGTSQGCS